jgi:hypothetical protein
VTDNIPDALGDCNCELDLTGLFDIDVGATCSDVAGSPCDITLGANGNLFTAVFSGLNLSIDSKCNLPPLANIPLGMITLAGTGSVSLSNSDIDSCSVVYQPPVIIGPIPPISCACNPDTCAAPDPFAVDLKCLGVNFPCVNFLDIVGVISDLLNLRAAEGKALVPVPP